MSQSFPRNCMRSGIALRVLEMAGSSPDKYAYERKIFERFGGQREFEFMIPPEASETKEAAN
jgi:hypothetical protein